MALQNRVDPWGELHAVPQRGTMMGNRGGKFHRDDKTLGKRRWASRQWICCELHFRGRHREVMGLAYTELFFLDEVTALAAGHRPCWECRRADAKAFLLGLRADEFDRELHTERLSALTLRSSSLGEPRRVRHESRAHASRFSKCEAPQHEGKLVNGAMVEIDNHAYAIKGGRFMRWSFSGYLNAIKPRAVDKVLTPPSIIAILAKGYTPRWHKSALQWDET